MQFHKYKTTKALKLHDTAHQFGPILKIGCQDVVFAIKYFLQERREKQLETHVAFVDLVKAYVSIKYDVINETLHVFGVPRDVYTWIMKLHRN